MGSKFYVWLEKSPDHANDGYRLQNSSLKAFTYLNEPWVQGCPSSGK
jgi:hypothetical protein